MKKILEKEDPSIIVTGHDQNLMDILFIKAANLKSIPSLTVQDGMLVADRINNEQNTSFLDKLKYIFKIPARTLKLFFDNSYPFKFKIDLLIFEMKYKTDYVYGRGDSLKIAVFGEATKRMLISEGVSPKKLEITGNPKFDLLYQFKDYPKKKLLQKKWGIKSDRKVVLILTQWFVEAGIWTTDQRNLFISEIVSAIVTLEKNIQLIIKLHPPHEKKEDYLKILENFEDFNISPIIFNSEPIHEIIASSDVIVSVSSTAALEAMAMEKSVLIVNLFNEKSPLFFKNSGALYVDKRDQIFSSLKKLLYCPDRVIDKNKMDKFVYEQAYIIDGNASKRIVDLIRKMNGGL